jgi:hypothetical protein
MSDILFQTGFDYFTTVLRVFPKTTISSGCSVTIGAFGRNSTNGMRSSLNTDSSGSAYAIRPFGPLTEVSVAFAVNINSFPSTGQTALLQLLDANGTETLQLQLTPAGLFEIWRGAGAQRFQISVTSSTGIQTGAFFYIEWYITVSNTVGATIVRVNEIEVINQTGLDTLFNLSTVVAAAIGLRHYSANNSQTADYDDVIIRTDGFGGDCQIFTFYPTAVGSTDEWTAVGATTTAQCVDEEDEANDDTDYIVASTNSFISLWDFDDVQSGYDIHGVAYNLRNKKDSSGTGQIAPVALLGTTTYTGATIAASWDDDYLYAQVVQDTSPATGITWSLTEFADGEYGVKLL